MRHVRVISRHKDVVVNMDTTYWGRGFGLMVITDTFRTRYYGISLFAARQSLTILKELNGFVQKASGCMA